MLDVTVDFQTRLIPMNHDISDILASITRDHHERSLSEENGALLFNGVQRQQDLQYLTKAWVAERAAPELLPYPTELVERVVTNIRRQVCGLKIFLERIRGHLIADFAPFRTGRSQTLKVAQLAWTPAHHLGWLSSRPNSKDLSISYVHSSEQGLQRCVFVGPHSSGNNNWI